ncbi:TPA: hypothetical protein N0F65_004665 [Lagenidium giganteum]|uniref:Uncharacterized protein n=1 Tax=Lagenidium giganteum TaxID=4803 RepID=A0AAV2Z7J6_9STRA|nr:TPA: hypothetical protein N0F65_004665 [Lagenidium giganteum]
MSPRFEDFATYCKLSKDIDVVVADGTTMKAVGIGDIVITCPNGKHVTVTNSLHIPKLDKRLMSVSKITHRQFNNEHCAIFRNNEMVLKIPRYKNVYRLEIEPKGTAAHIVVHEVSDDWNLWHARMGNTNADNYKRCAKVTQGLSMGMKDDGLCGGCAKGKMTVTSFPKSTNVKKMSRAPSWYMLT